jgi:hypothetical protein
MELTVKAAVTKFCNLRTEPSVFLKAVNSLTVSSTIKFWNKRLYFAKVCYVQTVIEFVILLLPLFSYLSPHEHIYPLHFIAIYIVTCSSESRRGLH